MQGSALHVTLLHKVQLSISSTLTHSLTNCQTPSNCDQVQILRVQRRRTLGSQHTRTGLRHLTALPPGVVPPPNQKSPSTLSILSLHGLSDHITLSPCTLPTVQCRIAFPRFQALVTTPSGYWPISGQTQDSGSYMGQAVVSGRGSRLARLRVVESQ